MTLGKQRARKSATLFLALGLGAPGLGGCASNYTMTDISNKRPVDAVTMDKAVEYSNRMKEEAVNSAEVQFNVGQGLNGIFIAAAGAATSLLAFDGNQTAAAGVGLGAGALGLTDRFLLIDESLAMYKNAVEALNCAESLLVPLAVDPSPAAAALGVASTATGSINFMAQPEANKAYIKSGAPGPARAAIAAVNPSITAAAVAGQDLLVALQAASDNGTNAVIARSGIAAFGAGGVATTSDTAAKRLVLFADQVRQTVNATILQKRATTEELAGAFKTMVGDYVKILDDRKKAAKQKVDEAKAAQKAALISTAATNAAQLKAVALNTGENKALAADAANAEEALNQLADKSTEIENQERAIDAIAANVPDETKIQACLVKIAGGGGSGSGGSAMPGS